MKKVTRKQFFKAIVNVNAAEEIYSDSKTCILLKNGIAFKMVQIGNWDCETSIDCTEVEWGHEDTEFYISI